MKILNKTLIALTFAITASCGTQPAWANEFVMDMNKDLECLVVAIYHEARGSDYKEMNAVGTVIMNRVYNDEFPDTVCDVIAQPYQFSFFGNGKPETISDIKKEAANHPNKYDIDSLQASIDIAHSSFNFSDPPFGKDVLFYHDESVDPAWAYKMEKRLFSMNMYFYRKTKTLQILNEMITSIE